MRHLAYLGMLGFCLVGTLPLEVLLRLRVCARWRRLLLSVLPVLAGFVAWDLYAISRRQWTFDRGQILGVVLPGGIPLEEVLFFMVVPVAAVLTLEAVRAVSGWPVHDERR